MNLGGEPERDDSGLPPVDVVVPDDARELERDVQAYRREQRALRRQQRRTRWHGPLTRDGVVLPLLATCLILALIAGTLLTFFTARPGGESPIGAAGTPKANSASAPTGSSQPSASATPGSPGASATPGAQGDNPVPAVSREKLPAQAAITVIGSHPANRPVNYSGLVGTLVVLVPADCRCGKVLGELINQAADLGVLPYVVGGGKLAPTAYISTLVTSVNAQGAGVAQDTSGTLASNYLPAPAYAPGSAPSALLIAPDGTVSVARALPDGVNLTAALRHLAAQVNATPTASDS